MARKQKTLKFLCPIIVGGNGKSDLEFDLEESEGEVQLKSCRIDNPWTVFEIKMFLDYFNRKELIFLFDGFDEICPLYTEVVMSLLKVVRNYTNRHVMWITSRFYEKVMSRLEQEFGLPYEVKGFNDAELDGYLWKYWQSTIILRTLNKRQCNNLCSFMEFMSLYYYNSDRPRSTTAVIKKKEKYQILFLTVCFNFLHYLRKELNICPDDVMQTFNLFFHDCTHSFRFVDRFDTPLHLYLCANYFQNQVNDERITPNRWNLDINAFTVYDNFIETKLKTIRFQEKNKIDLHNPDNLTIYEKIREDFFVKHYKLGAYAVFNQDLSKIFDEKELSKIRKTIENIKIGTEKTGLVQSIINGIPTFIHRTFTEYFAVEYICQLLKSATGTESQRKIWDFILNVLFLKCDRNVRQIFSYRLKTDNVLKATVYEHGETIFDLLLTQGTGLYAYNPDDFSKELYLKIRIPFISAMEDDLVNFVTIISNLKENINTAKMYRKREGTSGIKGQLYETKLISLINFRAKFDNSLKDFYLATNMADIGIFDDISFRAKAKIGKNNKQIAIFIQAKHREADKTVLTLNSANDLSKWFDSYLTIKRSFKQDTKDVFFKGKFQDIDSYFIMYTTAKDDRDNVRFDTEVAHKLNSLIATGNDAVQPNHKETHVEFLCDIVMKEQLVELATVFAEFVNKDDNTVLSMNNDLILIYHVILAKKFFLISEIRNKNEDSEHRIARFRSEFYTSDDEFMKLFRDTLYKEILKKRALDDLLEEPLDVQILAKLIHSVVTLNKDNGKLEFVNKSVGEDLRHRLEKVKVLRANVHEAISIAAEEILRPKGN
ncbi:hypothetical protein SFRURICE_016209 [Spodoptera frugiperda]|nr:hypothetical protein SFRURICE_016209 [Spodoptera frugiperda]